MAKSTWIMSAVLAMGLSGALACDGTPSPETVVSCSAANPLAFQGPTGSTGLFFVVKVITIEDSGLASGAQPANNLAAIIYGDSPEVALCEGRCDGAGTFGDTVEATTDENGVLEYTVRLTAPTGTRAGNIVEVFGNSICTNAYTSTGAV